MSAVLTYDPRNLAVVITPATTGATALTISGFSDDDMIEVDRDVDAWMKKVGVDGQVTRSRQGDLAAKITLKLMQSSSSNDDLTGLVAADEAVPPAGAFQIAFRDPSGRSVFRAAGWIKKPAKATFKKDAEIREWVIDCATMDAAGGNFAVKGN